MKKRIAFILLAVVAAFSAMAQAPAAGSKAPDFALADTNGKTVTLQSLQGKWVVLDFWGSWCGWCIKGFPEMKKSYAALKGKAEFVGIAYDKKEAWLEAVRKYELPWVNLFAGNDKKVLMDYGVEGFPTKVIIDPKGIVRNVTVGEDPAFYTTLQSLVK